MRLDADEADLIAAVRAVRIEILSEQLLPLAISFDGHVRTKHAGDAIQHLTIVLGRQLGLSSGNSTYLQRWQEPKAGT